MCTHKSPIYSSIGRSIHNWLDEVSLSTDVVARWLYAVVCRSEEEARKLGECCEICGKIGGLQLHHLAGRRQCYLTITVCCACHMVLSKWQKLWDARWLMENQSPRVRKAFLLMGIHDVLRLCAHQRAGNYYEALAAHLTEEISKRLRG